MASRLPEVATQNPAEGVELIIVHIPNISHSKNLRVSQNTWPKLLPELVTGNARVLQFQHEISIEDPFSWSQLFEEGIRLLDSLFCHQILQNDYIQPIVCITEGLAGLVLKNALVTADRQPQRYKSLLESVVGLILIGVPHIKGTGDETLQRLATLLRPSLAKVSRKSLPKNDISRLEILSEKFREVHLPLPEGLISGYETLETILASGVLSVRRSVAILVDKKFARIDWPRDLEQLLPVDVHLDAVLQPSQVSQFRSDLKEYIARVIKAASGVMDSARTEHEIQSIQTPAFTSPFAPVPRAVQSSHRHAKEPMQSNRPNLSPSKSSDISTSLAYRTISGSDRNISPPTVPSMLGTSDQSDSSFEILSDAANFRSPTHHLNLPCYLIKPHTKNKRFWPRDEPMKAIEDVLLPLSGEHHPNTSSTLHSFVLHGMGGVGKTEIATEFVFKHQEKFDAIFFMHAEDRSRLSSEFVRMASALGLEDDNDAETAKDTVRDWLANPIKTMNNQRSRSNSFFIAPETNRGDTDLVNWLIVFDNADDPEVLLEFWPHDGYGSILVTSRDPMARDDLYFGETGLELRELPIDEGAAFLRSMTVNDQTHGENEASRMIASRLEGLPLAIEQIGAIIRRQRLGLQAFLDIYKGDAELEALQDQRIARKRGYEHSIASVWALGDLPAGSLAILNVISFLDPTSIQVHLLMDNLAVSNDGVYPKSLPAFMVDLNQLVQGSIISQSADGAELRIHRLVQDVARARMRKVGILEASFDSVVNILWTAFPKITRGGVGRAQKVDRWAKCAQLFPHVSRLGEFYSKDLGDKKSFKSRLKLADLLNEAGWYQFERTNPFDTIPVVELAQQICEESTEDATEQLALIFGTRTWTSALIKEHEMAYRFAKERLSLEERLFARTGKVTANFAAAYNDMAAAYSMNGLPSKAFLPLQKSKELRESMPTFKPEHNFSPLHELSLAHWHLKEYKEAADCLLEALRDRIAALGENDRQSVRTGQLYYAIGNVRASHGLLDESAMWHQKALVHYRSTAGDNHYKTACACYRVAEHCVRSQQFDIARGCLDQAIKVFEDRSYYQQENSRACFLYHQILRLEGKAIEAKAMLDRSVNAFNTAFPQFQRAAKDLSADDFESLCTYDF